MIIFADKNILAVESGFGRLGDLHLFDGRSITQQQLAEADVLLVRSITQVNESLLANTKIRFVGTATSGTDHIDLEYLTAQGIKFADAKGCNANAVVDYCFSAIAYAVTKKHLRFEACRVGIVGAGEVGGLLAKKLQHLNITTVICDPPRANSVVQSTATSELEFSSLAETLKCDVVSLHVPLQNGGEHPTNNLINLEQLNLLPEGALLINACRGGVVNEQALLEFLSVREDVCCIFDVFSGEPNVNSELVNRIDIGTPHIAGYSTEAKVSATQRLAKSLREYCQINREDSHKESKIELVTGSVLPVSEASFDSHWNAILNAFPIKQLGSDFKQAVSQGNGPAAFDRIRCQLLRRQEFCNTVLEAKNFSEAQAELLSSLGFKFQ